jgi:hypothetical protein
MPRLTLQDVYNSRIPQAIGACAPDPRIIAIVNEAQQRLLSKGMWWGSCAKYRLAAYGSEIAMPAELDTIETMAINHVPVPVHDFWFEFLDHGFGTRSRNEVGSASPPTTFGGVSGCLGLSEANLRGNFPTFRSLTTTTDPLKIVLQCDIAADVGVPVTVLGYDANGNWIRTIQSGIWTDGEVIALAQGAGTTSVNTFSRVTDIQFNLPRVGQCWLYELDTVTSVTILSGWYQWWETRPSYARWLLPSVFPPSPTSGCTPPATAAQTWTTEQIPAPSSTCSPSLIEIIGKKAYIPVSLPTDYLIIQNIPALKLMAQCVKKQEDAVSQSDVAEAMGFETLALKELDDELDHHLGSGRRIGMNIQGSNMADGCAVQSFM